MAMTTKTKARGGFARPFALLTALLVYVSVRAASVAAQPAAVALERRFATAAEETTRERAELTQRFETSRTLVMELLANEREEMALFREETRFKMQSLRQLLREEMRVVGDDVRALAQSAVANVTAWRKQRQELRMATKKKYMEVQASRERKEMHEAIKRLEEERRAQEQEQEKRAQEEEKKQQEQRGKEARELKRQEQQKREKEKKEEALMEQLRQKKADQQRKQEQELKKKQTQAKKEQEKQDVVRSPELPPTEGWLRKLARWSDATLLQVSTLVKLVSRQLLLPVGAILGFFLVATIAIAKYNAMQQARRKKRILYSSYPKNYRPRARQRPTQTQTQTRVDNVETAPPLHWRPRRRAAMDVSVSEDA